MGYTQEDIHKKAILAKCCMANYAYKMLKARQQGRLKDIPCLLSKTEILNMAIAAMCCYEFSEVTVYEGETLATFTILIRVCAEGQRFVVTIEGGTEIATFAADNDTAQFAEDIADNITATIGWTVLYTAGNSYFTIVAPVGTGAAGNNITTTMQYANSYSYQGGGATSGTNSANFTGGVNGIPSTTTESNYTEAQVENLIAITTKLCGCLCKPSDTTN